MMTSLIHCLITGYFLVTCVIAKERVLHTYKDHPCIRPCQYNQPRVCQYDFHLEYYFTLSKACYDCPHNVTDCSRPHCVPADGYPRGLLTVNRMLPGPAIHVCEGDTVIVNVNNQLTGAEGTSIHWHGVHQTYSGHMDGVAMVTQCPIPAHSSFQYRFKVDNAGTHFWHAHSGIQRADGLFGALVVRQSPDREPHLGLYAEDLPEHTMIVNDWLIELSINRFAHHHHAGGDNKPKSMLINGKGVGYEVTDEDLGTNYTPVEVFHVELGKRFRFRTISNGILNCPIQISIDNHTLTMIASDGNPFEKVHVESFNIFAGERFDFVLHANQPVGNYWVRARGMADCGVKQARQVAILRYNGAAEEPPQTSVSYEDADREGKKLNPWNKKASQDLLSMTNLTAKVDDTEELLKEIPDKKIYLAMDFNKIDNYHFHHSGYYPISAIERPKHLYLPQMNHITTVLPSSPPLTQLEHLDESIFCNHTTFQDRNCTDTYCECVFRLMADLGDVVELIVIDEGVTFNANHPMHLHGHSYRVVGMDRLNQSTSLEDVKRLDEAGLLPRKLSKAVLKDTVTVPDGGYTIMRFHATNPGVWFFHCHIEFHAEIGMGLLIQVGHPKEFPKTPKNFPRCGNWEFDGYQTDIDQCKVGTGSNVSSGVTIFVMLFATLMMMNNT